MTIRSFLASLAYGIVLISTDSATVAQDAMPESGAVTAGVIRQPLTAEAVSYLKRSGPAQVTVRPQVQDGETTARDIEAKEPFDLPNGDVL